MISRKILLKRMQEILNELDNYRDLFQIYSPDYLEELDDGIKELYNARQGLFIENV